MKGYYITEEDAIKYGLLNDTEIKNTLQQTLIVITIKDLEENKIKVENQFDLLEMCSDWFYKNYFDSLIESFRNIFENGKD